MSAAAAGLRRDLLPALLPPVALVLFIVVVGVVTWLSRQTFGYDFLAYHLAAARVLAGQPLYDMTYQQTGGFGLFYYPPPFILAVLPFALLPASVAAVVWFGVLLAAFFAALALLPVRRHVRWIVLLLAALSWPVAYTFKLGQVTPLLMLAFVIAWRSLERPVPLGGSTAAGALIKLQPAVLLVWAALTRRWRAVAVGLLVGLGASVIVTAIVGMEAWWSYIQLVRAVGDPVTTPHNVTPGALAYQAGASAFSGAVVQVVVSVAVAVALLVAVLRAVPEASFLVAVTASQMLSPILWDHYAMLLLLPIAWLLERRQWWAIAIALVSSVMTIGITPPAMYSAAFVVALLSVLVLGVREAPDRTSTVPT